MRSQFWWRGPVEKKNQKNSGPGTSYKHDFSHRLGKYKRQLKKLHRIFSLKKSLNWVRIRSFFIFSFQPDPVLRKSIKKCGPGTTSDPDIRRPDKKSGSKARIKSIRPAFRNYSFRTTFFRQIGNLSTISDKSKKLNALEATGRKSLNETHKVKGIFISQTIEQELGTRKHLHANTSTDKSLLLM